MCSTPPRILRILLYRRLLRSSHLVGCSLAVQHLGCEVKVTESGVANLSGRPTWAYCPRFEVSRPCFGVFGQSGHPAYAKKNYRSWPKQSTSKQDGQVVNSWLREAEVYFIFFPLTPPTVTFPHSSLSSIGTCRETFFPSARATSTPVSTW